MRTQDKDVKGLGRVVRGRVSSSGGIISGTGFTITKGAAGAYTIVFTPPFTRPPVVQLNIESGAGFTWGCNGAPTGASALLSFVVQSTGVSTDTAFSFVAEEAVSA